VEESTKLALESARANVPGGLRARSHTVRGLAEIHVGNNTRTASHWALYAGHRARLQQLLVAHGGQRRLAILGAGNGNDLDLEALAGQFGELHLADLDGAALDRSARRLTAATRKRVRLHRGRDLSGLLPVLPAWRERAPTAIELAGAAPFAAALVASRLPGPFDVVVSDCLLSQISWTCFQALAGGPLLSSVLCVALAAHLRALVSLAKPGGRCLLVTDAVSSDTVPLDDVAADEGAAGGERGALLRRLDSEGRLFSGTSPALALSLLGHDPYLSREVVDAFVVEPWVWRLSPQRSVLVYALSFRRRSSADA
jgi:hypothetical protein